MTHNRIKKSREVNITPVMMVDCVFVDFTIYINNVVIEAANKNCMCGFNRLTLEYVLMMLHENNTKCRRNTYMGV